MSPLIFSTFLYIYLELQTTRFLWLFQLDDSKSLHKKRLFHQTSTKKRVFGVPGKCTISFRRIRVFLDSRLLQEEGLATLVRDLLWTLCSGRGRARGGQPIEPFVGRWSFDEKKNPGRTNSLGILAHRTWEWFHGTYMTYAFRFGAEGHTNHQLRIWRLMPRDCFFPPWKTPLVLEWAHKESLRKSGPIRWWRCDFIVFISVLPHAIIPSLYMFPKMELSHMWRPSIEPNPGSTSWEKYVRFIIMKTFTKHGWHEFLYATRPRGQPRSTTFPGTQTAKKSQPLLEGWEKP